MSVLAMLAHTAIGVLHNDSQTVLFLSLSLCPAVHPLAKTPILSTEKQVSDVVGTAGDLICWTSCGDTWSPGYGIEVYNWKTGIRIWVRHYKGCVDDCHQRIIIVFHAYYRRGARLSDR